jgi:hypothetical protein
MTLPRSHSTIRSSSFCATRRRPFRLTRLPLSLAFYVSSLLIRWQAGLLFPGAAALGSFRVDEGTNTVMGDAVTDTAQWYEASEWIGVHFTPRSCLELSSMYEATSSNRRWAMFHYDVPLRDGRTLNAYAINWPKILMVPRLSPWKGTATPRAWLLQSLSQHRVPMGTERKYLNTVAFFDHSQELDMDRKKKESKGADKRNKKRRA